MSKVIRNVEVDAPSTSALWFNVVVIAIVSCFAGIEIMRHSYWAAAIYSAMVAALTAMHIREVKRLAVDLSIKTVEAVMVDFLESIGSSSPFYIAEAGSPQARYIREMLEQQEKGNKK